MSKPPDNPAAKLNHRRRAVYWALSDLFGERKAAVAAAFRLWEREFANRPYFVVTRFVSRCAETIGLSDSERIALTRRTFDLMAITYELLDRYPDGLLDSDDRSAEAPAGGVSERRGPLAFRAAGPLPAQAVISGFVGRALLAAVRAQARGQNTQVAQLVTEVAENSKLPGMWHARLIEWCTHGGVDDSVLADLGVTDLRQWIHVLYLAACDACGPVAADRLLSQAVTRAANLPAAGEFPPEQLL